MNDIVYLLRLDTPIQLINPINCPDLLNKLLELKKDICQYTLHPKQQFILYLEILQELNKQNVDSAIIKVTCKNLYLLAKYADDQAIKEEVKPDSLEECARFLSKCFTSSINDRTNSSRKYLILHISSILFKIYLRLNTPRLCQNLIRAIDNSPDFPPLHKFPKSEAMTFLYYRGRIYLGTGNVIEAIESLFLAYNMCHPQDHIHQKSILTLIIPIQLILRKFPTSKLLSKHNLITEYGNLVESVKTGNIFLFEKTVQENQLFYLQKDVFLLIQVQVRYLVIRNFFKKIYKFSSTPSTQPRIDLNLIVSIYTENLSIDQLECWLVNLIQKGLIKGYISHEKKVVVLSRKDPFPVLDDISKFFN